MSLTCRADLGDHPGHEKPMGERMRAAMFNGPERPITVEDLPDPRPGPGELLVRVCRCGICGSDVSMTSGGPDYLPLGRFGHEWSGEVVEVGRDVEGIAMGARITALPVARCGECERCATGNPLFCERAGYLVGGFGEYMVVPPHAVIPLPRSLSLSDGALGGAPDIVAERVGRQGMLGLASQHVRPRGTIVSLGMCQHGDPVVPGFLGHHEVRLLFPRGYTVEEFEGTARAFDAGRVEPEIKVSDVISLEAWPQIMDDLHAGTRKGLKIHVDPAL